MYCHSALMINLAASTRSLPFHRHFVRPIAPSDPAEMVVHGQRLIVIIITACCLCASIFWLCRSRPLEQHNMRAPEVGIVVAKQSGDDTTWLQSFSEWRQFLYITDDPTSEYVVPAAKGNEAMVYLTSAVPKDGQCVLRADLREQFHYRSLRHPPRYRHIPPRESIPVA